MPKTTTSLAEVALPVLRACAAIADESLDRVAPTVSLQQYRALTVLHEQGPQNAAALAEALGIAPSTLTRLSNRLVRDRLVERVENPTDRRAVVLTVSRSGARVVERVRAWRLSELERRLRSVMPEEVAAVHDGLTIAAAALGLPAAPRTERTR